MRTIPPFGFVSPALLPPWPIGTDGPLNVSSGTFVLAAGSVKDYSSINIALGATLEIDNTGGGVAWTVLGCSGACQIDGEITGISGDNVGGTFVATAPDGKTLSYTVVQQSGGAGGIGTGNAYALGGGFPGGATEFGNGGGGGSSTGSVGPGGSPGQDATISAGGNSGTGDQTIGMGASVYGQNGTQGVPGDSGSGSNFTSTGGGGGSRGAHGQGLYLKVAGVLSGAGSINFSGQTGGNGGKGAYIEGIENAGGGGGAGAGGSGGKIVIRYTSGGTVPTTSVVGGAGGSGGNAANGAVSGSARGGDGTNGSNGSTDIATY